MTKAQLAERNEARDRLREWLKPGDTVHTILRHVSRSGMSRRISVASIVNGNVLHLDGYVADALGYRLGKDDGLVVGGCGMDMGFHVVYNLSRVLWPDGYGCIGAGCPSNDHSNGDRDYTPHHVVGGCPCGDHHEATDFLPTHPPREHWHRDGGYALRHRWL